LLVLGVKLEPDCDAEKQANRKLVYDIICVCIPVLKLFFLCAGLLLKVCYKKIRITFAKELS
jgi:hypothetical protein